MPKDSTIFQIINNLSIKIEEQRFNGQQTIPQQVNLEINQETLGLIAKIQEQQQFLLLPPKLLTDLRYYSLLSCCLFPHLLPIRTLNSRNLILQAGLVFTTYYCQDAERIAVISSNISAQGQISQQICREFLLNFVLLKKIINVHYWTINQILQQLPLTHQKASYLWTWILPLLITLGIATVIFMNLSSTLLIKAIAIVLVFVIAKFSFQYLINKYLLNLFLQQLLFGFFSHNYQRRKLGFTILRYLFA